MDQVGLNWAVDFQLHEVACIVVGEDALSNLAYPAPDRLPSKCIPVLQRLIAAYDIWRAGDRSDQALSGVPLLDAPSKNYLWPLKPSHLEYEIFSVVVSREEVCRWLQATKMRTAFDFKPHVPGEAPNEPMFSPQRAEGRIVLEEALDAIQGRRRLSIFFADEVLAKRIRLTRSDRANLRLPGNTGESWELAGDVERLPRGLYTVPLFDGSPQALVVAELARVAGINSPQGLGFPLGIVIEDQGVRYLLHHSTSIFGPPKPAISFPSSATLSVEKAPPKPIKKIESQGARILSVLRELGYEPRSLPLLRRDDGPKEKAWGRVKGETHLFSSKKTFDKAWEKLRSNGDIADDISPTKGEIGGR